MAVTNAHKTICIISTCTKQWSSRHRVRSNFGGYIFNYLFLGETVKGMVVLAVIFHFYNIILLSYGSDGSIIVRWQAPDVGDIACFFFRYTIN